MASPEEFDWGAELHRLGQLHQCIEKLPLQDRQLLQHRYSKEHTVNEMAGSDKRLAARLYKRLHRIRELVGDCVRRRLAEASHE